MKRLITLSTLALSVLLASSAGVGAVEILNTKTQKSINPTIIAAKSETSSQFVTVKDRTVGTLKVVELNGQKYLEFGNDFQTVNGPAVEIILHKNDTVPININEADYISLAPIKSTSGTQRYAIPENVDLANYSSVAVWCEEFNVTFGYASL